MYTIQQIKRQIVSMGIIASMLIVPVSYSYAALSCSLSTEAACTGTILLRLSSATNAHAELPSGVTPVYSGNVICCTSGSAIGNSCSGNFKVVGRLSSATNAHVQETTYNTYGTNACLSNSTTNETITIGYQNTDCTGYDTTLFSLSSPDNGSVGGPSAYTRKACATISSGTVVTPPSSGNGGGSGVLTGVLFSGVAYPNATIYIWKDGVQIATTLANAQGIFTTTLKEEYNPSITYTLYSIDTSNRRSLILNYPVVVKTGFLTQITGIRFAPTLALDKTEAKLGDIIVVTGSASPGELLAVVIDGVQSKTIPFQSDTDGSYQITIPLTGLPKGDYNLHVEYRGDAKISSVVQFTIGETNILNTELATVIPGDCNADRNINLTDFSVMAFWYGKPNPPSCVDTNSDGIINLTDFSILAFYWTG